MRPPGLGAVPRKGLIQTIGRHFHAPSGHFCWGLAEYDRPLTEEEVSGYELELITDYELEEADDN